MPERVGFEVALTTLHYPAIYPTIEHPVFVPARPAVFLARDFDFQGAFVEIPLNGAREAEVVVSMHDPITAFVAPYKTMLWVRYRGKLAFWGVIPQPNYSDESGDTVTLHAVDRSLSMQHHYLRYGDDALIRLDPRTQYTTYTNMDGTDETTWGSLPLNSTGYRRLMWAARLDDTVTTQGVPDLGVKLGTPSEADTFLLGPGTAGWYDVFEPPNGGFTVNRGDEVWKAMTDLAAVLVAPDFELEPIDRVKRGSTGLIPEPYYARLNCFDRIGSAYDGNVHWDDGWRRDNAKVSYTPGGRLVTHAHVLSADGKDRITRAQPSSSVQYGVYVEWDATQLDTRVTDLKGALESYGDARLGAYGVPPDYFTVSPKRSDVEAYNYHYGEDYVVGTEVESTVRRGLLSRHMSGRITKVTLRQQSAAADDVIEEVDVIPTVASTVPGDDLAPEG